MPRRTSLSDVAGGSDQEISEIKQRLALIEARLEQLFTHLDVQPRKKTLPGPGGAEGEVGWWGGSGDGGDRDEGVGEPGAPSEKVIELVRAGNKIEAIKVHHEETGLGLKESKDAIEAL